MSLNIGETISILGKILDKLSLPDCDILWSHYDSQADAVADLNDHIEQLKKFDFTRIDDLKLLFAPTGDLQEISISNGWEDEFLEQAILFDRAIESGIFK